MTYHLSLRISKETPLDILRIFFLFAERSHLDTWTPFTSTPGKTVKFVLNNLHYPITSVIIRRSDQENSNFFLNVTALKSNGAANAKSTRPKKGWKA